MQPSVLEFREVKVLIQVTRYGYYSNKCSWNRTTQDERQSWNLRVAHSSALQRHKRCVSPCPWCLESWLSHELSRQPWEQNSSSCGISSRARRASRVILPRGWPPTQVQTVRASRLPASALALWPSWDTCRSDQSCVWDISSSVSKTTIVWPRYVCAAIFSVKCGSGRNEANIVEENRPQRWKRQHSFSVPQNQSLMQPYSWTNSSEFLLSYKELRQGTQSLATKRTSSMLSFVLLSFPHFGFLHNSPHSSVTQ